MTESVKIRESSWQKIQKYSNQDKGKFIIRPIVEPEEYNVQYDPNSYTLVKNINYQSEQDPERNSIGINTSSKREEI
jgi:hypothetical protein